MKKIDGGSNLNNVREILTHERRLDTVVKLRSSRDGPQSIRSMKLPPARPKFKPYFQGYCKYNPYDYFYPEKAEAILRSYEQPVVDKSFFCSCCKKGHHDKKLAFKCDVEDCQRSFCNNCYHYSNHLPFCASCNRSFCAVCDSRVGCSDCNTYICKECNKKQGKKCTSCKIVSS